MQVRKNLLNEVLTHKKHKSLWLVTEVINPYDEKFMRLMVQDFTCELKCEMSLDIYQLKSFRLATDKDITKLLSSDLKGHLVSNYAKTI